MSPVASSPSTAHQAALEAWEAGDAERAHGLMRAHLRDTVGSEALNDFAVMAASAGDRSAARAMLRAALVLDDADADALANLQSVDSTLTGTLLRSFAEHWGSERTIDYRDALPPYATGDAPSDMDAAQVAGTLFALAPHMEAFYARLDARSRELLLASLLIRSLGARMVPPPLDVDEYRAAIRRAEELIVERGTAHDGLCGALDRFDLRPLGIPLELHSHIVGIVTFFLLGQYRLQRDGVNVMVEPGDVVIDGGACWGDTSVYFSELAGRAGRVVALEFDPANVDVLQRNLRLNPEAAGRVELVQRALHSESGHELNYEASGYGTSLFGVGPAAGSVETVTIDDLVDELRLPRVDFIKMDIEAAEGDALLGARRTLARFQPRLAIAAYHRNDDFVRLPALIDALAPGYRFHVGHYTLHLGESILYATVR